MVCQQENHGRNLGRSHQIQVSQQTNVNQIETIVFKWILFFYRKDETEEEKAQRLSKWADFLSKEEQEEDDDESEWIEL